MTSDLLEENQDLRKQIAELEKENAELKSECRRCVYTDCPCVLSDYGKDRNGICDHFKDVFDENAELKEQCSILADCNTCTSTCKTENIEMKKQLTKAKEIIRELVRVEYADFTNGDYSNELSKVLEQAE
jgi:cell division septum initiation protein DivIVA